MKGAEAILVMFALVALTGCTKYSVECELIVKPYARINSSSAIDAPAYRARVYVYYIDHKDYLDMNWRPESYADADAGVVRHRMTGEIRTHSLVGQQSEEFPYYVHLTISSSPMMLVAVDPVNRFYAYRKFEYRAPLDKVLIPVTFKVWQWEQTPYREEEWTILSERRENTTLEEGER